MEEFEKQELDEMQDVYGELIEIKVAALRELASKMPMKDFFYITFEDGAGQLFSEGTTLSNGDINTPIGDWHDKYFEKYVKNAK